MILQLIILTASTMAIILTASTMAIILLVWRLLRHDRIVGEFERTGKEKRGMRE